MIERAIEIAMEAHKGQTDKNGQPYIQHVLRVGFRGRTVQFFLPSNVLLKKPRMNPMKNLLIE